MRNLTEFSGREWRRLKPLDHFMIQVCNDVLQRFFRLWKPESLEPFLRNAEHLRGKDIGLIVAYEQPWALSWLLKAAAGNLGRGTLLVFDNSRRAKMRTEIERVCRDCAVGYLGLPPCPTRHPNRSHGMAMTWIFHNVVRAIGPRTFTFIDHDLIPLGKTRLGDLPANQPFYGLANISKWGWSLWAGYCSYDFPTVDRLPLNFLNDFSRGLDTGGRNWRCLYRHYDRSRFRFGNGQSIEIADPVRDVSHSMGIVDDSWVHLGGISYSGSFQELRSFYEYLAKATGEGAMLRELTVKKQQR